MDMNMKKMIQLPEYFPLRYAMVIFSPKQGGVGNEGNTNFLDSQDRHLFFELIDILKRKPFTEERSIWSSVSVKAFLRGEQICKYVKLLEGNDLNRGATWVEETERAIKNIVGKQPLVFHLPQSIQFKIAAASYSGLGERPTVLMASQNQDNEDVVERFFGYRFLNDGYPMVDGVSIFLLYQGLKDGTTSEALIDELASKFTRPRRIDMPYSYLWSLLDKGTNQGMLPRKMNWGEYYERSLYEPREIFAQKTKIEVDKKVIQVLVCDSWESLFLEEIRELYRMIRHCNNCGLALSPKRTAKYCDPKLSKSCGLERARKRQKAHNEKKKL
jgi:hypothetical protein